jgi:hypothetical protein
MLKKQLSIFAKCFFLFLGLFLSAFSLHAQGKIDASPCEAIKGKTYIGWSAGQFDDNPDAASAIHLSFDAQGNGKARSFMGYRPTDNSGVQQSLTATCATLDGGKTAFLFRVNGNIDAGTIFITSYDNGARIWVESAMPSRPMKGWLLQEPAKPRGK